MTENELEWRRADRERLVDVMFGDPSAVRSCKRVDRPSASGSFAFVGFGTDVPASTIRRPSLVVVPDRSAIDLFAWVRTYSPQVTPLSQFCRVLGWEEWSSLEGAGSGHGDGGERRTDRWASLILGEGLAQLGHGDVGRFPLASAKYCLSSVAARVEVQGLRSAVLQRCLERLDSLEGDERLVKRRLSISDLRPMWSVLAETGSQPLTLSDAVEVMARAASGPAPTLWPADASGPDSQLFDESVEERVRAYRELSDRLSIARVRDQPRAASALALAAFLVGRGTSHGFLLERSGPLFPQAQTWFGFVAGVLGADYWDPSWARASKTIERELCAKDPGPIGHGADLCWIEFAWMASVFDGMNFLSEVARQQSQSLILELHPGVLAQVRLSSQSPSGPSGAEVPTQREVALLKLLEQFVDLARTAQSALGDRPEPGRSRDAPAKEPSSGRSSSRSRRRGATS